MTMKARLFTLFAALCLCAVTAFAERSFADIRRRMEERLPQIDALKAQEVLGENNRGFVELRKAATGAEALAAAENSDRINVYAMIAFQTGATPEHVGQARAHDIAEHSKPGVWVQDKSGTWRKK